VQAYGSLVNENALTKACSRTTSKTAEMLAQYCDQLLKRSRRRSADEIDDSLADVVSTTLFVSLRENVENVREIICAKGWNRARQ